MGHLKDALIPGITDTWLTPPDMLAALGPFDLDPCAAPEPRPWPTAGRHIARPDDGLTAPWVGRVWLNPPYANCGQWVGRLAGHGCGTALIFARTETGWFMDYVWRRATAALFLEGRIRFIRGGTKQPYAHNAPAPSVLVAYGSDDADRLARCGLAGAFTGGWCVTGSASQAAQEALFGGAA